MREKIEKTVLILDECMQKNGFSEGKHYKIISEGNKVSLVVEGYSGIGFKPKTTIEYTAIQCASLFKSQLNQTTGSNGQQSFCLSY